MDLKSSLSEKYEEKETILVYVSPILHWKSKDNSPLFGTSINGGTIAISEIINSEI